jgi:uncharacterized membrane protein YjjP (DUF1212 family)
MKKLILLIAFLLPFVFINAQVQKQSYDSLKTELSQLSLKMTELTTKLNQSNMTLEAVQYNLNRYQEIRKYAFYMEFGGIGLCAAGFGTLFIDNVDHQLISLPLFTTAAVAGVAGIVTMFTAEKWLKKSNIQLSTGGIRINF